MGNDLDIVSTKTCSLTTLDLTDKQRAFVEEYVATGKKKEAAIKAGYSRKSAHNEAWRLMKLPHVQEYLRQKVNEELSTVAVPALRRLVSLVEDGKSEYVQMQAATSILDRAGYSKPEENKALAVAGFNINIDLS